MNCAPRVKGYEMLDRLAPCPLCGSLQWWFDGEAVACSECD
jgi:hypothetical protein